MAKTIRRKLKDGSEVTEPLANGGYRITRCDTKGRTTTGMTVLPIADTGGKRYLLPAVIVRRKLIVAPTYGDPIRDTRYREVLRRGLKKLLATVLPPTPGHATRDPDFAMSEPRLRHRGRQIGLRRQKARRKPRHLAREPVLRGGGTPRPSAPTTPP